MNATPEIVTERMVLRGFTPGDAADVFAYSSDPAVLLHTTGRTPRTVEDSAKFVECLMDKPPGAYAWAVRLKDDPRVIGAIEFGVGDGKTGGIHYALGKDYWNRGLMTEACRAVLDWAFRSHPDLERVTTLAVTANRASTRVMEKCGMRFERTIEETWDKFDHPVELGEYSIERSESQALRTRRSSPS